MAHYTVYKLTDPEGKCYIGYTGKPVKERWDSGWGYNRGQPIRIAIDRYGWRNFRKDVLCGGYHWEYVNADDNIKAAP